ncbi:MAG: hypothetical protein HC772_16930 [Leptolyngbyaceae cyanobacterium CRU_2_3]|nr:hypothetical protein [Leptolyngbyaceae cyanobacterium CRU_2_3]
MNLILLSAALIVSILVFAFLVRVLKAAVGTAIAIALIILLLQLAFGIAPPQLWQEMQRLWENLRHMVKQ